MVQCRNAPTSKRARPGGWLSSALLGVFFAAGCTLCAGASLGAILTLGFSQETVGQAMVLASGHALGLGLPFLAIGLAMDHASPFVRRFRRHLRAMETVSGVHLMAMGLMLVTTGPLTMITT